MELEKLQKKHLVLLQEYELQETFVSKLFDECLPVCAEIVSAKGIFKIFKILKLAVYLAKYLIDMFDKKPSKIDYNKFY
jgi:hypothetical protein